MPNEPSFPTDLMSMVAGLGRNLVQRLPEEPVTPPLTPLEPFYGAGKAPRLSLKDIGNFLIPQSPLDVGLMAVPGGKLGKPTGKAAKKAADKIRERLRHLNEGEVGPRWGGDRRARAGLVPAVRVRGSGKEYLGRLGHELEHEELIAKNKLYRQQRQLSQGYVDVDTGEWLTEQQAAKKVWEMVYRQEGVPNMDALMAKRIRARGRAALGRDFLGNEVPYWGSEFPDYTGLTAEQSLRNLRRGGTTDVPPWNWELPSYNRQASEQAQLENLRRGGSTVGDATPPVQRQSPQELVEESDKLTARIGEILSAFGREVD